LRPAPAGPVLAGRFAYPRCSQAGGPVTPDAPGLGLQGVPGPDLPDGRQHLPQDSDPRVKWHWLLYRMAMEKVQGLHCADAAGTGDDPRLQEGLADGPQGPEAVADQDARYRLAGLVEPKESLSGPRERRRWCCIGIGTARSTRASRSPGSTRSSPTPRGPSEGRTTGSPRSICRRTSSESATASNGGSGTANSSTAR